MSEHQEHSFLKALIVGLMLFLAGTALASCAKGLARDLYEIGRAGSCGSGSKCGF